MKQQNNYGKPSLLIPWIGGIIGEPRYDNEAGLAACRNILRTFINFNCDLVPEPKNKKWK